MLIINLKSPFEISICYVAHTEQKVHNMSFAVKKKKSHEMAKLFCSPGEQLAGATWVKSQNQEGRDLGRSLVQPLHKAEIKLSCSVGALSI